MGARGAKSRLSAVRHVYEHMFVKPNERIQARRFLTRSSRWRRNVRVHGTAGVVVHSTATVQSIYGTIQEYAGIERPEWLDCRIPSRLPP